MYSHTHLQYLLNTHALTVKRIKHLLLTGAIHIHSPKTILLHNHKNKNKRLRCNCDTTEHVIKSKKQVLRMCRVRKLC